MRPRQAYPKYFVLILGIFGLLILSTILLKEDPNPIIIDTNSSIKIGFIEIWGNESNSRILFEEIIEPEVNQYAMDHGINKTFEFMVVRADDGGAGASEKVVELHNAEIKYVIGSNCIACVSYHFIMDHDMVLISPWSPQNMFSIEDEHMFRVCPADKHNARPIKKLTESLGVKKAVMMLWKGNIGDDIYEGFDPSWINKTILEEIRYQGETTDFSHQLYILNKTIHNAVSEGTPIDDLGVISLCYAEITWILNQTSQYPLLREVKWVGYAGTARLDESEWVDSIEGLDQLGVSSPVQSVSYNERWDRFASRYYELTGEIATPDVGYDYDAAWLFALTLMESGTGDRAVFAEKISDVASSFEGVTGVIRLDEFGDRMNACFDIWCYVDEGEGTVSKLVGYYDGEADTVTWFTD